MAELHRKVSSIRSFFWGQTRSSREVTPSGVPAAFGAATLTGISPTTAGSLGSVVSTIRIPGRGCLA
jgi:hypothetical protein